MPHFPLYSPFGDPSRLQGQGGMLSIAEYFLDSWRALGLKCLMARPSRSLLGAVSSIFYTV